MDSLDPAVIISRYKEAGVNVRRYFEGLAEVEVRQCADTAYRFYAPLSVAGGAEFYADLYDPTQENWTDPDYRVWGPDYQFAFERIVEGERLLDLGCGYGYFLRRAAEQCQATGIDGNPHAVERCRALGLDVKCGRIEDFARDWAGEFDTVCSFQVLEHVVDVASFIRAAREVLKPGGRMILGVPNNEPYSRRHDAYVTWNLPPHHVGLWDLASLSRMAQHFGMKVTDHGYGEVSGRWLVEAYLHARRLTGVTTEIHHHTFTEKLRIAALAPFLVPISIANHLRRGGLGTRNIVSVEMRTA